MKIYIGHSTSFNFKEELYQPIRASQLNSGHEIIFPHENGDDFTTKDIIKICAVMVAEVSYPSTGLGIELGYADCFSVPIICLYKKGATTSSSLKTITSRFLEYSNKDEMIALLDKELENLL